MFRIWVTIILLWITSGHIVYLVKIVEIKLELSEYNAKYKETTNQSNKNSSVCFLLLPSQDSSIENTGVKRKQRWRLLFFKLLSTVTEDMTDCSNKDYKIKFSVYQYHQPLRNVIETFHSISGMINKEAYSIWYMHIYGI